MRLLLSILLFCSQIYQVHANVNIVHKQTMPTQEITIASVHYSVQIGALAGNRNLEFGVKNMLEEFLQEEGHEVSDDAPTQIKVEILYLDVLKTKSNLSVFHKNKEAVVIRMRGKLIQDGKVKKTVIVEEQAEEAATPAAVSAPAPVINITTNNTQQQKQSSGEGGTKIIERVVEKPSAPKKKTEKEALAEEPKW